MRDKKQMSNLGLNPDPSFEDEEVGIKTSVIIISKGLSRDNNTKRQKFNLFGV